MFKTIYNTIKLVFNKAWQYIGLVDDIVIDTLKDLKSLRYQLVLAAYILNFYVLHLIYIGKADYKLATVSICLLTAVYAFFFHSKAKQAEIEANAAPTEADGDPDSSDKDPDNI
jgi:uncharacterized membrane protein